MKGKIEVRFNAPNVGKVRTRLVNPDKELTAKIRGFFQEAAAEVIEEHQVAFRAKVAERINALAAEKKIEFSSKAHQDSVCNPTHDFFAIFCEPTKERFEARFSSAAGEGGKEEAAEEAPAGEAGEGEGIEEFDE